jgi:4-phospho-D-threonate 3-dehydrogenase / 4-phospho-D-erythronate 3-dehydrogenase
MTEPVLAVTMGDAAGIGPEICLKAVRDPRVRAVCRPRLYGSPSVLEAVSQRRGMACETPRDVVACTALEPAAFEPGTVSAACGRAAADCITAAVRDAMQHEVRAVVTAPINKDALGLAGVPYPGHTEMLADLTGAWRYAMMLASDRLVVSLATIHMAYAHVPAALSVEGLLDVMELTRDALRRLGRSAPRLAVCGLNPHGGEAGRFGREEIEIIQPAIEAGRARGWALEGPLPPDTAFIPERLAGVDAVIVMYHDQGLIPFKMLAFDTGVNITLGLPIVRTSPDHGTAFDLAWQGKASAESMVQALLWAVRLSGSATGP